MAKSHLFLKFSAPYIQNLAWYEIKITLFSYHKYTIISAKTMFRVIFHTIGQNVFFRRIRPSNFASVKNTQMMKNNVYKYSIQPEDVDQTRLSTIPSLYRKVISAVANNIRKEGYGVDVLSEKGQTWVLVRCGIEILRRPELYADLTIAVWKGDEDSICHSRNVEIYGATGEMLGCGITDWSILDKESHRPVVMNLESTLEAKTVTCKKPRRIIQFEGGNTKHGQVGYSECDFNGHLNNCRYVDWFFNLLPEKATALSSRIRLDINFKREILKGADIIASIKEICSGQIDFCIRQSCGIACLASLSVV